MKAARIVLLLLFGWNGWIRTSKLWALPEYCEAAYVATQQNELDRLLGVKIAERESALSAPNRELVKTFYEPCGYALAWISRGQISPSAIAVLDVLRSVSERGLNPRDYPDASVPYSRQMGDTEASIAEFATLELNLTVAALHLATDLRCGRVDPHVVHAEITKPCETFLPTEFVWRSIAHARNPDDEFESLEPSAPGYQRTKQALRRYLDMTNNPKITLPPFVKQVYPGEVYEGAAQLRDMLANTGDLTQDEEVKNLLYSKGLVLAVQSFQRRHGLPQNGVLTVETYQQLSIPLETRITQLALTLERWRWVPRTFIRPPVVVNVPEFKLRAYNSDLSVAFSMKVIVGGAYHRRTPVFENQISAVIFRPYWNIPPNIERNKILPAMRRDPKYLAKHDYEVVRGQGSGFRIRQRPGDRNALGLVKFSLPNSYDVYLHGTPAQNLFDRTRRDFSHGCIRVEDPVALARWVLRENPGWTQEKIETAMHGKQTQSIAVAHPVPVLIVYATGFAAENGEVYFLPDIYGEDKTLLAALRDITTHRQVRQPPH